MMDENDAMSCDATATGILECLRMLADEAASLQLGRTLTALHEAIVVCAAERFNPLADMDEAGWSAMRVIH